MRFCGIHSAAVALISPGLPEWMGNALHLLIRVANTLICTLSGPIRTIVTSLPTMTLISAIQITGPDQALDALHLVDQSLLKASQSSAINELISGQLGLAAYKKKFAFDKL